MSIMGSERMFSENRGRRIFRRISMMDDSRNVNESFEENQWADKFYRGSKLCQ